MDYKRTSIFSPKRHFLKKYLVNPGFNVLFISALHHNACHNQKDVLAKQELPEIKELDPFRETNFLNFSP
jgi:hypothetical protein